MAEKTEKIEKNECLDWAVEAKKLKERGDSQWWKPTPGQHVITFLSDGVPKESVFEDKVLQQVQFEIEVGKQRFLWDVTRGQTKSSLFGQICLIAGDLAPGPLAGAVINLVVKGKGKETSYTVLEALPLMEDKVDKEAGA